jgi:hypothetical protein
MQELVELGPHSTLRGGVREILAPFANLKAIDYSHVVTKKAMGNTATLETVASSTVGAILWTWALLILPRIHPLAGEECQPICHRTCLTMRQRQPMLGLLCTRCFLDWPVREWAFLLLRSVCLLEVSSILCCLLRRLIL